MPQVKIVCPKCKEVVVAGHRTSVGFGHGATDEALAIDKAIKEHKCKAYKT